MPMLLRMAAWWLVVYFAEGLDRLRHALCGLVYVDHGRVPCRAISHVGSFRLHPETQAHGIVKDLHFR